MRAKSKFLEALYRYKNKVLQRLKLEKYKISRLQANKFKKRVLKHIGVILNELGLRSNKKSDTIVSLLSYKLLGDTLAQNVHFNNLRELIQLLFLLYIPRPALHSISKKSFSLVGSDFFQTQNRIAINKTFQMYYVRSFKDLHTQKIWGMLKKIRSILKNKAKSYTELTLSECVDTKSKQIKQMYIQQILKNRLSKMVSPLLKKEEVYYLFAGGLID